MGGAMGFGPVVPEADEPPFHADWEKRALAVTLAMGATGQWNLDMMRFERESLPPLQYLGSSYYQIWLAALSTMLVRRGLASEQEIAQGRVLQPAIAVARTLHAADVPAALARGAPTERPAAVPAAFAVGDAVHTRELNPTSHIRLPRYVRDKPGTIFAVHGCHVFPDTHAAGQGESPQWLYTVRFEAHALWGPQTTADAVFVDCWEPYLRPVEPA